MTTSIEYNKIHALARARKVVMNKYGSDLLNFWPMADDSGFIRDLLRHKPLFGKDVAVQSPGMLDYGIDLQQGFIASVTQDKGVAVTYGSGIGYSQSQYEVAAVIEPGIWDVLKTYVYSTQNQTVRMCVAPANIAGGAISDVEDQALFIIDVSVSIETALKTFTFPFSLMGFQDQYWAYFRSTVFGGHLAEPNTTRNMPPFMWLQSDGTWAESSGYSQYQLIGSSPQSWPAYDRFTVGVLVNVDNSPTNAAVFTLANAMEKKAQVYITNSRQVQGYFKNTNGNVYTLTAPPQLHPGFNLITLSYERNSVVKLGVNGVVVATSTPNDYPLLNETLTLAVGAQMLADSSKTVSAKLRNAVIDDVFLAGGVVADADLWDIYMAYITAAPLMQVEPVVG